MIAEDLIVSRQEIEQRVDMWVKICIGDDFTFREHQRETIVDIIENILSHKQHNMIIEAPTGSGKSLINIISAGVLAFYYKVTSYILVSDLFLWEQYENFLKEHKFTGIASLKGQTGNYTCLLNNEDIKNADCRIAGLSWSAMFNKSSCEKYGYDCAEKCEYIKARKRAIKADVCIMTYQLFLFIMNNDEFNTDSHGQKIFKEHDVLFCDEAHNIPSIVQLKYAPDIVEDHFNRLEALYNNNVNHVERDLFDENMFTERVIEFNKKMNVNSFADIKKQLYEIWNIWCREDSRIDEDYKCMKHYFNILYAMNEIVQEIQQSMSEKRLNGGHIDKDDIALYKLTTWYNNYMCHWNDFLNAISAVGVEYLLKDMSVSTETNKTNTVKTQVIHVAFKCTKEDFMVYNYLCARAKYRVFVSATIGGKAAYDENMGFRFEYADEQPPRYELSEMHVIPSTFDFTKSPVHFLSRFKMSFKEKNISFNHIKNVIYSICMSKFSDKKGMIQTGSYDFAKRLYNEAPHDVQSRMLLYNGSREKNVMIQIHQMSENTILVGPTLNEGIDLPGDDCRFIIIMKVPYPSLANKLVKAKTKLFPLWYNSTTSNQIIQGIGRGVRYDGDWCVTYILDACFWNLYLSTKEQYPIELQQRINRI